MCLAYGVHVLLFNVYTFNILHKHNFVKRVQFSDVSILCVLFKRTSRTETLNTLYMYFVCIW